MSIRLLKFGWEFPPNNYGGLGVACQGLVHGLIDRGIRLILVLPYRGGEQPIDYEIIYPFDAKSLVLKRICLNLLPYQGNLLPIKSVKKDAKNANLYGLDIFQEVFRYAQAVRGIVLENDFDVIHAHDWLSIKAAMEAKRLKDKPLVFNIHATEFDRTGGNGAHPEVYRIEKEGMEAADHVVAVSEFMKRTIVEQYQIDPKKITVVHHGVPLHALNPEKIQAQKTWGPIVLFLGRLTLQKGPDYFVAAAKKILKYRNDVTFIIAGSGDMEKRLMKDISSSGIADNILFTGFLKGDDALKMLKMADVFVMPSVSEPFGLAALEAMSMGTPVIISKHAGVCEVVKHCLTVDFWDIHELANKIISVLEYKQLHTALRENAKPDIAQLTWNKAAEKCINLYKLLGC